MNNWTGSVTLSREEIEYLMNKTGSDSLKEAVEIFMSILLEENVGPDRMKIYLNKVMEKDGVPSGI